MRPRRSDVDVTDDDAVRRAIAEGRPDVVVDAAAFHKVEACEQQPAAAFAVNAVGASTVARAAENAGARCVYVSTDYVFDGENEAGYVEADAPGPSTSTVSPRRPVSVWCSSRLPVRSSCGRRLFGHAGSSGKGGNFIETMLAVGSRGEPICGRRGPHLLADLHRRPRPSSAPAARVGACREDLPLGQRRVVLVVRARPGHVRAYGDPSGPLAAREPAGRGAEASVVGAPRHPNRGRGASAGPSLARRSQPLSHGARAPCR